MNIYDSGSITRHALICMSIVTSILLLATAFSERLEPILGGIVADVLVFGILTFFRIFDKEWP